MRQPVFFVLVGGLQYLVDATLFGLFISTGLPTTGANVSSRITAAALGFILNRYVTFEQRNDNWQRLVASLFRFSVLFTVMTIISTVSLLALENTFGDQGTLKIVYKLMVEAVLAIVSFVVSKYWVFGR